jgi:hypothetical protein
MSNPQNRLFLWFLIKYFTFGYDPFSVFSVQSFHINIHLYQCSYQIRSWFENEKNIEPEKRGRKKLGKSNFLQFWLWTIYLYERFKFPPSNVHFFLLFLIFRIFLGNKSLATTSSTSQPRFISQGHTYRAVVGETLTLPCEVENLGEFVFSRLCW